MLNNLSLLLIIICAVSKLTSECLLPVKTPAYIVPVFGELLDLDFPPNNSTILWVHVGNHSTHRHYNLSKDLPSLWCMKEYTVNTWKFSDQDAGLHERKLKFEIGNIFCHPTLIPDQQRDMPDILG